VFAGERDSNVAYHRKAIFCIWLFNGVTV